MREADVNRSCADHLVKRFQPSRYYKHNDRGTVGMPDSSFTWNRKTTWLEFKLLSPTEGIHAQLDRIQLTELIKLERAGLAWVVAYRKQHTGKLRVPRTEIYRPTALLTTAGPVIPVAKEVSMTRNVLRDLQVYGVAMFEGFDHNAVGTLIELTHGIY